MRSISRLPGPDEAGGFISVHLRHLNVHQNAVEAILAPRRQRGGSGPDHGHAMTALLQEGPDETLIDRVIFRDQDGKGSAQGLLRWRLATWGDSGLLAPSRGLARWDRCGDEEGAALALGAFQPHSSPHHGDEFPGDGQTEAGTSKTPGDGPVSLPEGLEDDLPLWLGDANACVGDGKLDLARHLSVIGASRSSVLFRSQEYAHCDAASRGEFHCVA